ncbi:type IV toxin-antitoxin system AbiEi family antitoxin domain-containing protein [Methanocella conradii]|uniref:type IV toxin-antitoxin system AbiEi family antitoxin domain-containing protein n=1 Tax=Methanocella conradii TaxID=1175444 RepID=UPI00064FB384|nr:type IV toxin-antitoxin system AbiEi family antitoxin [Methanocella conradii]
MRKLKQQYTKYIGISANESFLLSSIRARDLPVFGVREVVSLCGWSRSRTYNTLVSLERKGVLTRIRRNSYAITGELAKNVYRIATEAVKPSYVSFWTALSRYGFTEQQVTAVQLVSTRQVPGFSVGPYRLEIVKFRPSRFYGYKRMDGFVIAEPEKALVDSLAYPSLCGGIGEFAKCLRAAWPGLDKKKFTEYLLKFKNKSLVSRAGYLIEHMELNNELVGSLLGHKSPGFVRLDTGAKKAGTYDHKWNIIINTDIGREEIR